MAFMSGGEASAMRIWHTIWCVRQMLRAFYRGGKPPHSTQRYRDAERGLGILCVLRARKMVLAATEEAASCSAQACLHCDSDGKPPHSKANQSPEPAPHRDPTDRPPSLLGQGATTMILPSQCSHQATPTPGATTITGCAQASLCCESGGKPPHSTEYRQKRLRPLFVLRGSARDELLGLSIRNANSSCNSVRSADAGRPCSSSGCIAPTVIIGIL